MNIIFVAPPAAGKGTISSLLASNYDYKHISTGDLIRNEIKTGSKLGTELQEVINKGELVSDELITEMLKKELTKKENQKFILDGYPRNVEQAKVLTTLFTKLKINDYIVLYLEVEKEIAQKRALGRIVCQNCGSTYNKYFSECQPQKEGICDKCQGILISRTDDNEKTFNKRFDTYLKVTQPVLDYYKKLDKLKIIDSNQTAFTALESIKRILGVEND